MAQHDYTIANQTFPNTRTDINNALSAIVSQNSGASAPSTTYAYQLWYDTTNNKLKQRNADNDAWIDLFDVDQTLDTATPSTGGAGGASGGLVHLSTQTLASDASEVAFNSLIDTSTYTNYKIVVQGHITGDGNHVRAVFRDSSDSDLNASNSYRGRVRTALTVANSTYMQLCEGVGGVSAPEVGFTLNLDLMLINQAANTSIMPHLTGQWHIVQNNTNPFIEHCGWVMRPDYVTTDVAGIRFFPSSGDFEAGSKFVLYGLAES